MSRDVNIKLSFFVKVLMLQQEYITSVIATPIRDHGLPQCGPPESNYNLTVKYSAGAEL